MEMCSMLGGGHCPLTSLALFVCILASIDCLEFANPYLFMSYT